MIFLIDAIKEIIKESKWYEKFFIIFHFYITIPASVVIAIYFIFSEYIFLKIIGILALCIYAFCIGMLTAIDNLED